MAKDALNKGPSRNDKAKLEQLEILQKIHMLYENGYCVSVWILRECLLSMYLKLIEHQRTKLCNIKYKEIL